MLLSLSYLYSSSYSRLCIVRFDLEHTKAPETSTAFLLAEEYIDGLMDAIRQGTLQDFRRALLEPDMLMLDGVDVALEGKDATQQELYYLLRKRHELKRYTVLLACVSPDRLAQRAFLPQLVALIRDSQVECLDEAADGGAGDAR
ncbi:MAG: hypothetical protein LUE61_09310 [Clostridiales bacterium]|nr:hypothetical protein [Clostridiales bacterium]